MGTCLKRRLSPARAVHVSIMRKRNLITGRVVKRLAEHAATQEDGVVANLTVLGATKIMRTSEHNCCNFPDAPREGSEL